MGYWVGYGQVITSVGWVGLGWVSNNWTNQWALHAAYQLTELYCLWLTKVSNGTTSFVELSANVRQKGQKTEGTLHTSDRTRVVQGSILCDPIQPSPSANWPDQTQVGKFGPNLTRPKPTQPNTTNNGAYTLAVTYFYTRNLSRIFSQPSINLFIFYIDHCTY